MKRILSLLLALTTIMLCTCCNSTNVKDERIIGTWTASSGEHFAFNEYGTAEILSPINIKDYGAENGSLWVSYGKFGKDYYSYEFINTTKEQGESVEILVLKHINSNTEYFLTKN